MENVASLVEDAALLLERSPARARSLLILAQEETGKAHRLYTLAETAWSKGLPTVDLSDDLAKLERRHQLKIVASLDFGEDLPSFWGDYAALDAFSRMSRPGGGRAPDC